MDILDLYSKPVEYTFTPDEIEFIKTNGLNRVEINYGIWRQDRKNGKYIVFLVDFESSSIKRSAIFKSVEIISTRKPSPIEMQEFAENFGFRCNNRKFKGWNYKNIEQLIADDQKYNLKTPQKFVDECMMRNLSGSYQSQLSFD